MLRIWGPLSQSYSSLHFICAITLQPAQQILQQMPQKAQVPGLSSWLSSSASPLQLISTNPCYILDLFSCIKTYKGQKDPFPDHCMTEMVKGAWNCEMKVASKRFWVLRILFVAHLDFSRSIVTPVKALLFGPVILLIRACLLLVHCLPPFVNGALLGGKSVWHVVPTWCPVRVERRARARLPC